MFGDNDTSTSSQHEREWTGWPDSGEEKPSITGHPDTIAPLDYWFGRKYLAYRFAQILIKQANGNETMSKIDARFVTMSCTYPFRKKLRELQDKIGLAPPIRYYPTDEDVYIAFATLIGTINRCGTSTQKDHLVRVLRSEQDGQVAAEFGTAAGPDRMSEVEGSEYSEPRSTSTTTTSVYSDVAMYTMKLHQVGVEEKTPAVYNDQQLVLDPPLFRVKVTFRNETFSGEASTKRLAKHQASKLACERFGIM